MNPSDANPRSEPPRKSRISWVRWALLALVLLLPVAYYVFHLDQVLSLETVQQHEEDLRQQVEANPVQAVALFSGAYILVTALALPTIPVLLTMLAGALFGRWWGTLIVSFASTTGATLACLASRYLFRDIVQTRFGTRLQRIQQEVDANGPYYLFTLRLVPAFPFFLINLAMGLTRMRIRTFWCVSQLGMLPGTFLYVNVGTELSKVKSVKDLLSWQLLVALALLGIVPLVIRKLVQRLRAK